MVAALSRAADRRAGTLWPVRLATILALLAPLPTVAAAAETAAPFTVTLLSGKEVRSEALAGRLVVLNFWALWCAPCRRELADLDAFLIRHGTDRVAIFAIDADRGTDPRRLSRQAAAITVPIATAISGGYRPRNSAVPTTFLIDPQGRLVLVKAGAFRPGEFEDIVASLLPASRPAAINPASGTPR